MALNCQRYDCGHNDKEGKCFAKTIAIGGVNAQNTDGTTCNSYSPTKGSQNSEFASEFIWTDKLSSDVHNIKCEARNCKYNVNLDCTAEIVEIDNINARCETFQQ